MARFTMNFAIARISSEMSPAKITTLSLGCRMNACEADIMADHAAALGGDNLVIVNSCAVTTEAVRQSRQTVRRAHRQHPDARLIVTGCAASLHGESFAALPGVDAVLDNRRKLEMAAMRQAIAAPATVMPAKTSPLPREAVQRIRAYVPIQTGCDHRCTFCVIPQTRGGSISFSPEAVIDRTRMLAHDYREIVISGIDIASWGRDLEATPSLASLIKALLEAVPEVQRLRLSSLDPAAVDDALIAVLAANSDRIMPYLHLSLQSGDDLILKRMRRRHRANEVVALCAKLRAALPDIVLGADFIAGFPTEDQAAFERSCDHIEACGLTYLHVFPFSPGSGTAAARMPPVAPALARERAAVLRRCGEARFHAFFSAQIGQQRRLVMETDRQGRSEDYAAVTVDRPCRRGDLVTVRLQSVVDPKARLLSGRVTNSMVISPDTTTVTRNNNFISEDS